MITIRPFKAIRPRDNGSAARIAALPYDVMSAEEARSMTADNPDSFLHVDKAEIDLPPGTDPYSPGVYAKARENLAALLERGALTRDADNCFYLYRQIWQGRAQTGVVGCPSVDDYLEGRIRKHELTRADKEEDRVRHVDTLNAQTGPIFLAHRPDARIDGIVSAWTDGPDAHAPFYDFEGDEALTRFAQRIDGRSHASYRFPNTDFVESAVGGVRHIVWKVDDPAVCERIRAVFAETDALYIADGHHRCASAARVAQLRRAAKPDYTGDEEFNFFLAVIFPADELRVMDYNRVVKDLNGLTPDAFLESLEKKFDLERANGTDGNGKSYPVPNGDRSRSTPYAPVKKHEFGMYLSEKRPVAANAAENDAAAVNAADDKAAASGAWYRLTAKEAFIDESNPVASLDAALLQENLLAPVLGIEDPRTDKRIDFVGGIRGLGELGRRADAFAGKSGAAAAFALYPVSMEDLMAVADAGQIMPPKSTWFEPKLLSGLFIHELTSSKKDKEP